MTDIEATAKERGYWLVAELADQAGVTTGRIRQVLLAGKLQGDKAGQTWTIPYDTGVKWLASRSQIDTS